MRLNTRTGGVPRPARPGRSLTGRSGGVPNRPPQGMFWPEEYATDEPPAEPEPETPVEP